MLPPLFNALNLALLALSFVGFVSANGRSGYNQVNQTENATGRSGYNQVNQQAGVDSGRSGYNKIKRSRRGAGLGPALYAIPADWSASDPGAFVMDGDLSCHQYNVAA